MMTTEDSKVFIRFLCVFGDTQGSDVIYVTKDDLCFGYGSNRRGCLGLSRWDEDIESPVLNDTLSHIQLRGISYGRNHCIGLTVNGNLYSWGDNTRGQLGTGSRDEAIATPQFIQALRFKRIQDVVCGSEHTLALTTNGQVYGWGCNWFGQTGSGMRGHRFHSMPKCIEFGYNVIVSLSCGTHHSVALTQRGQVFVWGRNDRGQLGHNPYTKDMVFQPDLMSGLYNRWFSKAVCGPNLTLLMSTDGYVYALTKQSGNEAVITVIEEIKFKDILSFRDNHLSVCVTKDNKKILLGFSQQNQLTLEEVNEPSNQLSIYDIYLKCTQTIKTFTTVVFKETTDGVICSGNTQPTDASDDMQTTQPTDDNRGQLDTTFVSLLDTESSATADEEESPLNMIADTNVKISERQLIRHIHHSFGNRETADLKFIIDDQMIWCHKKFLEIRCPILWKRVEENLNKKFANEFDINVYPYEEFNTFIAYLYGYEPQVINEEFLRIAYIYGEDIQNTIGGSDSSNRSESMVSNSAEDSGHNTGSRSLGVELSIASTPRMPILTSGSLLLRHFENLFNNPNDFDLIFVFKSMSIFGHRFVISRRNWKFWTKCSSRLDPNNNKIRVKVDHYEAMYAFLQFLYGIIPQINDHICGQLSRMSDIYGEQELKDICTQHNLSIELR